MNLNAFFILSAVTLNTVYYVDKTTGWKYGYNQYLRKDFKKNLIRLGDKYL